MTLQCSICISVFKDPVCLPCGHVYCKKCIIDHVNVPTNTGMTSTCPDCRSTFHTVIPDLTYLPEKYHPFISPAVRRVYIDVSSHASLQKKLEQAEKQIVQMRSKEAKLQNRNDLLANALSTAKDKAHELEKVAQVCRSTIEGLEKKAEALEKQARKKNTECRNLTSRIAHLQQELEQSQNRSSSDFTFSPLSSPQPVSEVLAQTRARLTRPLPRRTPLQRRVREDSDSPPPNFGHSKKPRLSDVA